MGEGIHDGVVHGGELGEDGWKHGDAGGDLVGVAILSHQHHHGVGCPREAVQYDDRQARASDFVLGLRPHGLDTLPPGAD